MAKHWWKALAVILLFYTVLRGFLSEVPRLPILHETIRNLYFHVPMWFTMIFLLGISVVHGIKYLSSRNMRHDVYASEAVNTALLFGVFGLLTGMLWARYTWGTFWTSDPHLNGSAITMLSYLAYLVLRNSMEEEQKKATISAIYSIFAFVIMIVFIGILPRMTDSLHPGKGGNPGFNTYDLDNQMKMIFYPAVIGWILLGCWVLQLRYRISQINRKLTN